MEWTRILAYITGSVDQELLLRNEYLAAENRILRAKLNGRQSDKHAGYAAPLPVIVVRPTTVPEFITVGPNGVATT